MKSVKWVVLCVGAVGMWICPHVLYGQSDYHASSYEDQMNQGAPEEMKVDDAGDRGSEQDTQLQQETPTYEEPAASSQADPAPVAKKPNKAGGKAKKAKSSHAGDGARSAPAAQVSQTIQRAEPAAAQTVPDSSAAKPEPTAVQKEVKQEAALVVPAGAPATAPASAMPQAASMQPPARPVVAAAAPAAGVASGKRAPAELGAAIATAGSRIELKERGFSIAAPTGWEVNTSVANLPLLMQIPKKAGVYQRTIQVTHGPQSYSVTGTDAEDAIAEIASRRAKSSPLIDGYLLRNQQTVVLPDGQQAVLFYAEFKIGVIPMMEMHLMVGNKTGHFLVTFTDIAEHFNMDTHHDLMEEAYNCLVSIHVAEPPEPRYMTFTAIGVAAAGVVVVFALITLLRRRGSRTLLDFDRPLVSDLPQGASDEDFSTSGIAPIEEMDDDDESEIRLKKTKVHRGKLDLVGLEDDGRNTSSMVSLNEGSSMISFDEIDGEADEAAAASPDALSAAKSISFSLEEDDDVAAFHPRVAKKAPRPKAVPVRVKK